MSVNRLGSEKSPYLKQHAHNPVWWFRWGEEAFAIAREQQKPIFLSIGYATCYWCHVMEKDSFEQLEVAEVLNQHFISIKVDREERPDVDRIYMDTVVALTGHGGWPLSVALTPELKPYWAGTFFYRTQFIQVLQALSRAWNEDRAKVVESASEITQEIFKQRSLSEDKILDWEPVEKAVENLERGFDSVNGGFGSAPKFPPPIQLALVLRYATDQRRTQAQSKMALNLVSKSLDAMLRGGIWDHLGGGFHRYATDGKWLVPHFEKMLYDNAQLCHLLCESFQVFGSQHYLQAAKRTADYVLRDLLSPEGAFFAAEDAGEVSKEGEFYVFTYQELKEQLSEIELNALSEFYAISEGGNFEHGTNILALTEEGTFSLPTLLAEALKKLFLYRERRKRPLCDTKLLTSWNALMIRALVKLYECSLDDRYLVAASTAADFLLAKLLTKEQLFRRYADGIAGIAGCLEDYSYFIEALLDLFCISAEEKWYLAAKKVQDLADKILWNQSEQLYFDSAAKELISHKVELTDGVIPSGNSVAASNLIRFSMITGEKSYIDKAESILLQFEDSFSRFPHAAGKALQSLTLFLSKRSEIVISAGSDGQERAISEFLSKQFCPSSLVLRLGNQKFVSSELYPLVMGRQDRSETAIYICSDHVCSEPLSVTELLLKERLD